MWPFKKKPRRDIFRYFDGKRERGIDPLVAMRRLQDDPKYIPEEHLANIDSEIKDVSDEAVTVVVCAARRAFELEAWREENGKDVGVTDTEAYMVLMEYYNWSTLVKKNSSGTLMSLDDTESKRSEESSSRSTTSA